jgi:hypothetical protein
LSISMEQRSNIFILSAAAPPAQSSGKSLVISQVAWCRDTPRLRDGESVEHNTHNKSSVAAAAAEKPSAHIQIQYISNSG